MRLAAFEHPSDAGSPCDFPTSTGPRPLNIWSDRTSVLDYEDWPSKAAPDHAPVSLRRSRNVASTASRPTRPHVPRGACAWRAGRRSSGLREKSRVLWPLRHRPDGESSTGLCCSIARNAKDRPATPRSVGESQRRSVGLLRGIARWIDAMAASGRRVRLQPSVSRRRMDRHGLQR